jgi:integrase
MARRKRPEGTRAPNGASSIYLGKDGYWHGRVTVGVKDNGKPDRRHVMSKDESKVIEGVRTLERQRDDRKVRKAGESWTVEGWLTHWLDNIVAPPVVTENAWSAYEVAVRVHLIPGIGAHRLDRLEPEHLEKLYRKMMRSGREPKSPGEVVRPSKPATAHQVHRTVRTALNEALRRRHIVENPALLAKPPRVEEEEVEPYSVEQVKTILEAAMTKRNSVRWAVALALGMRQGECLGIKWSDIDWAEWDAPCTEHGDECCGSCVTEYAPSLTVRRSRLRPRWRHGCSVPCGRRHGGYCPDRVPVRPETGRTKSKAGRRTIGLPEELVLLLAQHRKEQDAERLVAGQLWQDTGYVFATPTGAALNPRTDWDDWKQLLTAAGVRDGRLHDARHTAATVLLLLGVTERAVMGVMGWSNTAMAARYQHMTSAIRRDVAQRVGGLLWKPPGTRPEPPASVAEKDVPKEGREPADAA